MFLDDELNALRDRMSQMSDDQLLRIVEVEHDDYREEAIDIAQSELAKRNIPFKLPAPQAFTGAEAESRSPSTVWCLKCGGPMRSGLLFADKELTILFSESSEERFLRVFACGGCGDVRLMVDLETEVEG